MANRYDEEDVQELIDCAQQAERVALQLRERMKTPRQVDWLRDVAPVLREAIQSGLCMDFAGVPCCGLIWTKQSVRQSLGCVCSTDLPKLLKEVRDG